MPLNKRAIAVGVLMLPATAAAPAHGEVLGSGAVPRTGAAPVIDFQHSPSVGVKRRAGTLWAKVGVLRVARNNSIQQGTAFLVGRCLAITAAHTAVARKSAGSVNPVHLFFGKDLTREADGVPVAWGSFFIRRSRKANGDWAVLRVKPCLGKSLGYLRLEPLLRSTAIKLGSRLKLAGHPSARSDKYLTVSSNCRIIRASDQRLGGWLNDCSLRRGGSGGPILWGRRVIAVAAAETASINGRLRAKASRRFANVAVPVRDILNRLKQFHPAIYGELTGDQRRLKR